MSKQVPVVELTTAPRRDDADIGIETTADALDNPASGRDRVGQVLEARYSLVRKVDEGGMGVVYEGRHLKLDRRVAVKVMDARGALAPSRIERFHREAQSLARFHSPHVVSAIDFGTTPDGVPFLVMDYLDGQDLRRILNEVTSLSVERTLKLVGDAIKGVQAAHREGYVHRDLKPENLFVTRNVDGSEHCRVLDFGIVKVPGATTLTADGGSVGTAGYMAPEQVRGEKQPDVRMDVFALGAILYECVSGQRAISGRSVEDVLLRTMRGEIPTRESMPTVARALSTIIVKAMAFEPNARYQSASDLGEALRAFAETENGTTAAEPVALARPLSKNRFGVLAVLLATTALIFLAWKSRREFWPGLELGAGTPTIESERLDGPPSSSDTPDLGVHQLPSVVSGAPPALVSVPPKPPPTKHERQGAITDQVARERAEPRSPNTTKRSLPAASGTPAAGLELEDNPY